MKYLKDFKIFESKKGKPNFQTLKIGDFDAYRGRDAEANDYVTFQKSDDDDLWFHAKGVQGSHLILKVKENLPSPEIIREAAEIVAKNSKANSKQVLVVYCKKKFVTKESGAPLGKVKVDYNNAEEITVYLN